MWTLFWGIWIVSVAVLWHLLRERTIIAIVMPMHTKENVEMWISKTIPQCWIARDLNVYLLSSSNSQITRTDQKKIKQKLLGSRCFKTVSVLDKVYIKSDQDKHPLGPSILFFHALASPSISMHSQWMFWMEPDVLFCPNLKNPWDLLPKHLHPNRWMIGGMMQSHSDPLAPFFSFAEHINGNGLYNLRNDAFSQFMERVQEEFFKNGEARFRNSFDVAIYQVARWTSGFWQWARIRHNFVYSPYIKNLYGGNLTIQEVCEEETLFVHYKQ